MPDFTFCPARFIDKLAFKHSINILIMSVCVFQAHTAVPLEHTYLADGEYTKKEKNNNNDNNKPLASPWMHCSI